jgi:putative ABC transport system permease protein
MIIREARRFVRSSPLLSISAVVVLALGMGASALALALLLAFSSLAYSGMRAAGFATIAEETDGGGSVPIAWRGFEELRGSLRQGTALAAYSRLISTRLEVNGRSRPLRVVAVSSGFFSVLTVGLTAGRDFSRVEEGQAGRHVAILSTAVAVGLFQSPQSALGRFVVIDGLPYEVVGVAPPRFQGVFGDSAEAWVPANCVIPLILKPPPGGHPDPYIWKGMSAFYGVAASEGASSADLVTDLGHSLPLRATTGGPLHVSQGLTSDPARDARVRKWLRLGLLLAVVFTIVSSLNYSLLLLARTPRYAEEVRLKKALGAGSGRLMAELMTGPAALMGAGLLAAGLCAAGGLASIARVSEFYGQLVRGGSSGVWCTGTPRVRPNLGHRVDSCAWSAAGRWLAARGIH